MEAPQRVTLFEIDPLTDPRWQEFVEGHPQGSIFHGTGWLRALAMTYGYRPVAFTAAPPNAPLANAIVFCEIRSWLTGHRFVSLPFTDHCAPLVNNGDELCTLLSALRVHPTMMQSRFAEIRGGTGFVSSCSNLCNLTARFAHHKLSLEPPTEAIFSGFHHSCIRRKIRRAEKESLRIECGRSDVLVTEFYRLQVQTRQRHGLPPQPLNWFKNLASTLGDLLHIRVAFLGNHAVAGIVTLTSGRTMIYKYGASEASSHHLGGVPLLMWSAIQEAKAADFSELDLGRSDLRDRTLVQFKERFGAVNSPLSYYRIQSPRRPSGKMRVPPEQLAARKLFRNLPSPVLEVFGRFLYRHVG